MVIESRQRPSRIQAILLILFALCPLPCIAFGLYYYHNAWLTIILFHIVLASLPLAYKVLFTDAHLLDYTAGELKDPLRELLYGLCASTAIVLFVMGPVTFVFLKYKPFFLWIMGLEGMVCNDFAMDCENILNPLLFAVYFSIVNPGIEECFWRVFLVKSLPADYKWIISALYANYHFFVCIRFVGIYQSILGFTVTFAVGILMQELKERYGLLTVVCGHMAFDLCAMMVWGLILKFASEEEAEIAARNLNGRYYAGRVISTEFSPVTDFKESRCRQYDEGNCDRGGYCNFMHLKHISRSFKKSLQHQMYYEHPEYKERRIQRLKEEKRRKHDKESPDGRRHRSRTPEKLPPVRTSEERRAMIEAWNREANR